VQSTPWLRGAVQAKPNLRLIVRQLKVRTAQIANGDTACAIAQSVVDA
jgi:hypothetical protein